MTEKSEKPTQQFDFGEEVGKALRQFHDQIEPGIVEAIEQLRWKND